MVETSSKFQCSVIAPAGRLLDCEAASVVIPAHDGLRGVLCNHTPMFCALGLGIMEVRKEMPELKEIVKPLYLMIDGGFALFAANLLKIVAYDAVCLDGLSAEQIEHIRQKEQKQLARKGITKAEYDKGTARAKFLEKLIELNKTE